MNQLIIVLFLVDCSKEVNLQKHKKVPYSEILWQSTFPVWRILWKKRTWIQLKLGETLENQYFARHWLHFYFPLRYLDYILNHNKCQRHQTNSYPYFQGATVILWLLCCLLRLDEQFQVSVCIVLHSLLFL